MLLNNRKFLEKLFDDEFTFTIKQAVKDPTTGRTTSKEVTYPEDGTTYKGRLSMETTRPTATNGLTEVMQTLKLFTFPEITIPAGSKIKITHQNVTTEYKHSGEAAIYDSHQEIPIELWRVKA